MPTYENTLTLAIGCSLTSVGNQTFAARQVSNLLEPSHGPKGLTPEITMTLVPEQTLKGVLTDIINTLVPEQTLTSNIKRKTITNTLIPVQTILSKVKNGVVTTTLTPTQIINTSASVLSNASRAGYNLGVNMRLNDGGTFRKTLVTTLTAIQGIIGYDPVHINLDGTAYIHKNVPSGVYNTTVTIVEPTLKALPSYIASCGSRWINNGSYFTTGTGNKFEPGASDFAIDIWCKRESDSQYPTFISTGNAYANQAGFTLNLIPNDSLEISISDGTNKVTASLGGTIDVSGLWVHIFVIVNRTTDVVTAYVNGVATGVTANIAAVTGNITSSGNCTVIGAEVTGSYPFIGYLSHARLLTGTCSTTEVTESFNNKKGKYYNQLTTGFKAKTTHSWDLNTPYEDGSIGEVDTAGNHDLTVVGAGIWSWYGPDEEAILDSSGNGCHGHYRGYRGNRAGWSRSVPTVLAGKRTGSLRLWGNDAEENNVNLLNPSAINISSMSAFTISCWANFDSVSGTRVLCAQFNHKLKLDVSDGKIHFQLTKDGGTYATAKYSQAGLSAGTWYHICATWDGSTVKVYVNGIIGDTTAAATTIETEYSADPVLLCTSNINEQFEGYFADCRIYNSALSASDVAILAAGNDPSATPGGWYKFEDAPWTATVENGDPVTLWNMNETYNFYDNVNGYVPSYDSSVGGLLFDGDEFLEFYTNKALTGTAGAIFLLIRPDSTGPGGWIYSQEQHTSWATNHGGVYITSDGKPRFSVTKAGVTNYVTGGSVITDQTVLLSVITDGSLWRLRINGVEETLTVSGTNTGDWFGDFIATNSTIGASRNGAYSVTGYYKGHILKMYAYSNNLLTEDEILAIEAELTP